jgi:sorbose reductase
MTKTLMAEYPEFAARFESDPPLGRMGDRGDLKGGIAYLLSEASSYVTGTDLVIDGGVHRGRSDSYNDRAKA